MRILKLSIVALVAILISGGVYLAKYQPLVKGSGLYGVNYLHAKEEDTGTSRSTFVMNHVEGRAFQAGFAIHNNGRHAVVLESVHRATPTKGVMWPEEVLMEATPNLESFRPFQPQELSPGETLQLEIVYRFGRCNLSSGERATFGSLPLRFSILGMDRDIEMDLGYDMVVRGRGDGDC